MNSKQIKILIAFLVAVLLFLAGFMLWNGSLFGKALPARIAPTLADPFLKGTLAPTPLTTPSSLLTPSPVPTEGTVDNSSCGAPPVMQIFVLGVDLHAQTDAIRLVRVDFVNSKVSVLSIPRDLWVQVPGLTQHGITEGRINAVYGYGEAFIGKGSGVTQFADTLYANYAITFDHYIAVQAESFVKLIDQIGGVDITLDKPLDGTTQPFDGTNEYLPYFDVGTHHLDGLTALKFIKIRYPDNDAHRVDRQTMLMQNVIAKLKDPANLMLLPGIGVSFLADKSLITDLSLAQVSQLLCLAKKVDQASVSFLSIPSDLYTPGRNSTGGYISIPSTELVQFVRDFWNGTK